jgi:hypothetical protein
MGFRVIKRDGTEDFTEADREEIAQLEDFIYNCGRTKNTPMEDRMYFGEFIKLIVRDALTFGHVAIEKVLTRKQALHRFRPLPAESVYLINKQSSKEMVEKEMAQAQALYVQRRNGSNDPKKDQEVNSPDVEYFRYVQMSYDQRMLAAFGDADLIFKNFNPQNFADSMGYCYSPLELAIINVTNHLNVENYNANFFTHGYAARGILHLKGTVTQTQLSNFRRQFYSTITGTQNAWRTPIVSGLDEVQWVQMAGSAKEMEYINFNNHLLRAICTQFQIDPVELGLDYLASANGRAPSQQANNEYKIEYSRERGLYPILMFIEDLVNRDIFPSISPELSNKYKFEFTGYNDETAQTNVALLQAEMSVHRSMNDLLRETRKDPIALPIADLPLNQAFWALVEKNMTKGEIRELLMGDKGAIERRELQYIPGDPSFMAWQQLLLTIDQQKKQAEAQAQQLQAQQEQAAHEKEIAHAKNQRDQELHEHTLSEAKNKQASDVVNHSESLKDSAKTFGATSKPIFVDGHATPNPINRLDE